MHWSVLRFCCRYISEYFRSTEIEFIVSSLTYLNIRFQGAAAICHHPLGFVDLWTFDQHTAGKVLACCRKNLASRLFELWTSVSQSRWLTVYVFVFITSKELKQQHFMGYNLCFFCLFKL